MKRLAVITAALIAALPLSGCISEEQRAENDANLAQAEKNAAAYIYDKYGFEAEMVCSEIEVNAGIVGPEYSGCAYITMEYNGRTFTVYINGETKNTDGKDDYQRKEIEEAVSDRICTLSAIECDQILLYNHYDASGSKKPDEYRLLYNVRFDGKDLDALTEEDPFCCAAACFKSEDLSTLDQTAMESIFGENNCVIYSYNKDTPSSEWFSQYSEAGSVDEYYFECYLQEYGVYINEAVFYENNSSNIDFRHVTPTTHDAGDFLYITESGLPLDFEEVMPEDADNWEKLKGDDKTVCTGTYELPDGAEDVCVYIRKSALPDDVEDCYIVTAWTEYDGSRTYSNGNSTHNAGEYICAELQPEGRDFRFTVVHCD